MSRAAEMAALYRADVPVDAIANQFNVHRPAVYKALRRVGVLPPYAEGRKHPPRKKKIYEPSPSAGHITRREIAPREPILIPDRTPCIKCGVRADIGCKHQRWAV